MWKKVDPNSWFPYWEFCAASRFSCISSVKIARKCMNLMKIEELLLSQQMEFNDLWWMIIWQNWFFGRFFCKPFTVHCKEFLVRPVGLMARPRCRRRWPTPAGNAAPRSSSPWVRGWGAAGAHHNTVPPYFTRSYRQVATPIKLLN